jgi:ABC-type ATPase with predicted acetyltransferase domain
MSDLDVIQTRFEDPNPRFSDLERMWVEKGTRDDWELLHELHYKAEGTPAGSRYWRCVLDGETIGVIVTASPKLLLKERHKAFPKLKPGRDTKFSNVQRAKYLNGNFRVISRFVVDTMYRGVGIAYRFQNLASRMEGNRFMEIQSSMSKYNLFAQRAGFRFVKPSNANKFEVGVNFFRRTYESNPADHEAIMNELAAMPDAIREATLKKTREFYYQNSALEKTGANLGKGTSRVDKMDPADLIRNLQQMTLASPLYGVFLNPDHGRELPERLPLLAFNQQGPSEPLNLEGLQ